MNYKQMIEQARANGMATEKKMWAAVETLSTDLLALEQTNPKLYWHILRRQHACSTDATTQRRWQTTT